MLTRGQIDLVNNFINDLCAITLPYGSANKKGQKRRIHLGVRPLQFWELAFPKEYFKEVLNTVSPGFNNMNGMQREMLLLQKARFLVKGKKIPKLDLTNEKRALVRQTAVGTYPFAIKDDPGIWEEGEKLDNGMILPKEFVGHERI